MCRRRDSDCDRCFNHYFNVGEIKDRHRMGSSLKKNSNGDNRALIGSVNSNGDIAMFANLTRAKYKVNGTGLVISVIGNFLP
jgi:hypothetical protein